ncbi:sodium-extruding oxaloacetate decarboxylase subunit alpha [Halomonas salifodinae]|uniref:sodium-extruding oxaloacetate decarboxylase subunit alpha n=1 Tax=Halomonas salifodinae TaxID=438745 RepID=UPI0033BE51CF
MSESNDPVRLTEVVLRDGHQSLIATRLRTEDMLPACPELDAIGYHALEVWGGATFDACVRFLKEDPWERLHRLKAALPRTPLQMLLRGQNLVGYRHYADDLVEAFVARAAAGGIDIFRLFDSLNDFRNLEVPLAAVKASGKHAQAALCYTVSPVHDRASFVADAKQLVAMGADSIAIKDMAGLLTPYATYELVAALVDALEVPVHLHTHATSGLAAMCHLKAVEAGCRHLDTCSGAFAGGTSHPASEALVAALQGTPQDTGLDLAAIRRVGDALREARAQYARFESEFTREDIGVQLNQIPGGMMSNLANQLREQNALSRIQEVFEEIPRVRAELGYPPLVTPNSQIVASQAVMNVLSGERYKAITNEVKRYLLGGYGRAPGPVDEALRSRAVGNQPVAQGRPADQLPPELPRLREAIGDLAESEEDLLTFALFPDIGRDFLVGRREGSLVPEPLEEGGAARRPVAEAPPTDFVIDVHGESYEVQITGVGRDVGGRRQVYLSLDGMPEAVIFEPRASQPAPAAAPRARASGAGHVTTAMPGTIVEVLVGAGQRVEEGQAILITEAMKMETEVHARLAGRVEAVHVAKGDRVTPGEVLVEIVAEA